MNLRVAEGDFVRVANAFRCAVLLYAIALVGARPYSARMHVFAL